jgi:hypothetical protein
MPQYNNKDFVIRDDLNVLSGSVIYGSMASGQIQSGMIGNSAVLNNNIASGSVDASKLASGLYFFKVLVRPNSYKIEKTGVFKFQKIN